MVNWASLVAQLVRIHLQCRRPRFDSWVWKIHWRRDRLPTPVFLGFPGGPAGKESACNAGDPSSIFGSGRSSEEGNGQPLQYSGLESSMDYIVHGVTKSWTHLSNFHFYKVNYSVFQNWLAAESELQVKRYHFQSIAFSLTYTVSQAQEYDATEDTGNAYAWRCVERFP